MKCNFGLIKISNLFGMGLEHAILSVPALPSVYLSQLAAANIKAITGLAALDAEKLGAIITQREPDDLEEIIQQARAREGNYGLAPLDIEPDVIIAARARHSNISYANTAKAIGVTASDVTRLLRRASDKGIVPYHDNFGRPAAFTAEEFEAIRIRNNGDRKAMAVDLNVSVTLIGNYAKEHSIELSVKPAGRKSRVSDEAFKAAFDKHKGHGKKMADEVGLSEPELHRRAKLMGITLLGRTVRGNERAEATKAAYDKHNGNIAAAAAELGIKVTAAHNRCKRLGLTGTAPKGRPRKNQTAQPS